MKSWNEKVRGNTLTTNEPVHDATHVWCWDLYIRPPWGEHSHYPGWCRQLVWLPIVELGHRAGWALLDAQRLK